MGLSEEDKIKEMQTSYGKFEEVCHVTGKSWSEMCGNSNEQMFVTNIWVWRISEVEITTTTNLKMQNIKTLQQHIEYQHIRVFNIT